ncbi:hypothetical protein EJ02DRAFT_475210 [Clathrospora elynae]|uniref:SnoaL-like domain-containing protein n=1 Tax=Clathrospora elynae TaxID=706981 RepID=A0A6A5SEL7_9PLEO|nr:hypothetical protein EJ02DRAFT_475210 [Clathrospora elynae]
MLFNAITISALATSTLAFPFNHIEKRATNPQNSLPDCGPASVTCKCPKNSFYQTSSSYAFWPVKASEITRLSSNFLDTAWFGTSPQSIEGNGTVVGAKRHLLAELPGANNLEMIVEQLTRLDFNPDGGYYMKFEMADTPLTYQKTKKGDSGLLAGSWDIVDVRQIGDMTYMLWDIHVCFMDPYDLGDFHDSAMSNLTAILKTQGKMPASANMIGPIQF